MVREALTGYWSLVGGLTEVTGKRARKAAKALIEQGDASRSQVTALAQEIAETSRANREALVKLVRYEAERAAGRLGFASSDDVSTLQGRVRELERSIAELRGAADAATPAPAAVASSAPAPAAPGSAAKAPARARAAAATKAPTRAAKAAATKKAAAKAPAKTTKTTKSTAAKATPRKRTADAAGAAGPGSPS